MLAGDGTARISARSDGIMNKITMFQHSDDFESFTAGQIVFREGDAADRMYVVLDGKVELSIHGKKVDAVEIGDAFGEMALIDEAPRSATATALTGVESLTEAGLLIVGLRAGTPSLFDGALPSPAAWVLGSEHDGVSPIVAERVAAWRSLPMANGVESLNVAVAAGILAYEIARRRA